MEVNSYIYSNFINNKEVTHVNIQTHDSIGSIKKEVILVIDISGSIPESISKAILLLSKTMSSLFYSDLLITGSKSTLYDYSAVESLDVKTVYRENGKDNDQTYFKNLVSEYRKYNTVIVFGDNHSPSMSWHNTYNKGGYIERKDGKKINKWEVKKIISFHTTSSTTLAGYADWFETENIEYKENWVRTLN